MSQSVTRALHLLTAVASEPRSLDELAEHINVHKTTVLRLLQAMEAERFVTHDSSHRYRLGSRLFDLAGLALEQRDVRAVAREHLERLNATTKQTVHLAVYESGEVVYVDKLDAMQGVRMYSRVGLRAPLHCTAVAKVLMAALPASAANARIAGIDFTAMTDRTIRTADAYAAELTRVRRQGYAVDHEEHEPFINCIAAPIRDGSGAVIAAASVSVPTISLPYADVLALLPALLDATASVSANLGWHPVVPIT